MARLAFDLSILRVLLVEDDTFSRELEQTAFQHLGVKSISFAKNAEEALDALNRGVDCDLLAFDWNLAMFDARALVEGVREAWPGISILMLTNNEGLGQIKVAREVGVDGCLIKPFSLDKLREAVQLALIAKLSGQDKRRTTAVKQNIYPEVAAVATSVREALNRASLSENENDDQDAQKHQAQIFADNILKQFSDFVTSAHCADKATLEVIHLHVDCLSAVMCRCDVSLDHETRNTIVDGLALASDLAKP